MASRYALPVHALHGAVHAPAPVLPRAHELAALGTVLCLHRTQQGGELAGWTQAVRAESHAGVDSDGMVESLCFFDARGQCCWRLFLLPESDFLGWDTLAARLPSPAADQGAHGVAERLWRRLAGRLAGGAWRACALRLHVLPATAGVAALAASPAPVSALGVATARRIVRQEGADGEVRLDDCCCEQAAADAMGLPVAAGGDVPLVRL